MAKKVNKITAAEGKVFRRIVSGEIFGKEIYLGYSYYIGGVLQDPPHKDVPEDFEEVDAPAEPERPAAPELAAPEPPVDEQ